MKQAKPALPGLFLQSFLVPLSIIVSLLIFSSDGNAQEAQKKASKSEIRNVEQIRKSITEAGKLFQSKKFTSSARTITKVQQRMQRMTRRATGEYRTLLQAQYDRLEKAHKLLTDQGQPMVELSPFPEPASSKKNSNTGTTGASTGESVSFVSTVGPILNAKCGRCHVNQARGRFSLKDFSTLMDSTHVTVGEPDLSHLIEVIEDGSMPKGGLKVTDGELKSLKAWIAEGAKFDGQNKSQPLNELSGNRGNATPAAGQGTSAGPAMMTMPTGNETVSFAAHVAPVLMENCGRCHMARNNRGNFNMAQFRIFIRGGDSGSPVKPGDSAGSTLVKRLRGIDGDVMPPRGKLDDEVIANIAKWIDEGAKFDPADAALSMTALAAKGKASGLSHQELVIARKKETDRIWKLAMSDVVPDRLDSPNFHLVGTPTDEGLELISKAAESLVPEIQRVLNTKSRDRFIHGNGTIFVLNRRYDFSEFGKMVQKREFPRVLRAYWDHNTTVAYSVTLRSPETPMEDYRVLLARTLASAHVADLESSIPRWFSDGMGFVAAAKLFGKNGQVRDWEQDAIGAAKSMNRPDDFIKGRLDEDKAGLVSYLFVSHLQSDRRRFKKLMQSILGGKNFDESFASIYGSTPEKFFDGYQNQWN